MTTPTERTRAVIQTELMVEQLAHHLYGGTGETVRVPRDLLRALVQWSRHYPTCYDINMSSIAAPHIWGPVPAPVQWKEQEQ